MSAACPVFVVEAIDDPSGMNLAFAGGWGIWLVQGWWEVAYRIAYRVTLHDGVLTGKAVLRTRRMSAYDISRIERRNGDLGTYRFISRNGPSIFAMAAFAGVDEIARGVQRLNVGAEVVYANRVGRTSKPTLATGEFAAWMRRREFLGTLVLLPVFVVFGAYASIATLVTDPSSAVLWIAGWTGACGWMCWMELHAANRITLTGGTIIARSMLDTRTVAVTDITRIDRSPFPERKITFTLRDGSQITAATRMQYIDELIDRVRAANPEIVYRPR